MTDGAKNLMLARAEKSVWDKPGFGAALSTYDQERWMTAAWASVLTMIGARISAGDSSRPMRSTVSAAALKERI